MRTHHYKPLVSIALMPYTEKVHHPNTMALPTVTVIRRCVVYEHIVMTLEAFNSLNKTLKASNVEDQCLALDNLSEKLDDCLIDTPRSYVALRGDVSSHVDDILMVSEEDLIWSDEGDEIKVSDPIT